MFTTRISRVTSLAMALTALLGLALPVSADESVPFRGKADAAVVGAEPVAGGVLLSVVATGEATRLGRFTREERVILGANGSLVGYLIFTAANGDQLFAEVEGGFISPTTAVGTYTFTGGTGRFRNASGGADFVGETTDGIHLALTFDGTIAS